MLYLVGIIITFFLAILLAGKRGKTTADRILTIWLLVMGLHLSFFYLFITRKFFSLPGLLGLELPFPLLHGPFLYLYTEAVTGQGGTGKRRLLHFLPLLISYLLFIKFYFLPAEQKILIYEAKGKGFETSLQINSILFILSGIVYFILSLRLLHRHKKVLQDQFSYTTKISLSWLRYLIYGIGLIWLSVIFGNGVSTFSLAVLFVIFIGYFGINQVGIFTQKGMAEPPVAMETSAMQFPAVSVSMPPQSSVTIEPKKTKYVKSSLSEDTAENIHRSLIQAMDEKRLYTNPELTLAELAQTLDVHPNNLSQVINTYEQKSFYDYVNLKRVEEFKRVAALPENQKFTLLGIARDCGFNSKTSFNRNFKNATGLSPMEYLKQANILLEQ